MTNEIPTSHPGVTQADTTNASANDWFAQFCELNQPNMHEDDSMQQTLYAQLGKLSNEEIQGRVTEVRRLMKNNGFLDGDSASQWSLDPIPYLISSDIWQNIEQGIKQRVTLLNKVLSDIVQKKQLLLTNAINARRVYEHPNYIGESEYSQFPTSLFMLAVDIGITENNELFVLQDHCQYPQGLGLLLENRIISRRVMSEEFQQCGVQRIAGFFQSINEALDSHTANPDDARIVIFSRGPSDPYYSEQVYLATYLGYTLVRSSDLTVRKGKLWLKALNGLKKVDVVFRWLDDKQIDSLEQTTYSEFGVPGMLQAIRSGNVKLVNNYGASLLNIPAVQNQLSDIALNSFNESLILKQPETIDAAFFQQETTDGFELHSYVDPTVKVVGDDIPAFLATQSDENKKQLFYRRRVKLKSVPFWTKNQLVTKPAILRFFAVIKHDKNSQQDDITVLPSALCVSAKSNVKSDRNKNTNTIKDAWVAISSPNEQEDSNTLLEMSSSTQKPFDLALLEGYIPSRTAESLFSLSTMLERTENLSRLLRVFMEGYTEWSMYRNSEQSLSMMLLASGIKQQSIIFPYNAFNQDEALDASLISRSTAFETMCDPKIAGGLFTTLSSVCQISRNIRELLSYDSQRILQTIEQECQSLSKLHVATSVHVLQSLLDRIVSSVMAFKVSLADSLSHSTGDFMFEIGLRCERMQSLIGSITTMLGRKLSSVDQRHALDLLLTSHVSSVTHRRRYRMHQSVATGIELLVLTMEYQRSIAYQVEQLISLSQKLPDKPKIGSITTIDKLLLKIKADCHLVDAFVLASDDKEGERKQLVRLMQYLKSDLKHFNDAINTRFFTHTRVANKLNWSVDGIPGVLK